MPKIIGTNQNKDYKIGLDRGGKMKILEQLRDTYWYFRYPILDDFYYDHVAWRIHHYIWQERCETCRNWHFIGKFDSRPHGTCDIDSMNWIDYHALCPCWNLDISETNYEQEDGCERRFETPTGKVITQISKGGVWQFYYNGEPKWWPK